MGSIYSKGIVVFPLPPSPGKGKEIKLCVLRASSERSERVVKTFRSAQHQPQNTKHKTQNTALLLVLTPRRDSCVGMPGSLSRRDGVIQSEVSTPGGGVKLFRESHWDGVTMLR